MNQLLQDVRFGARLLLREPLLTICVVFSLALGVGVNCATFSYASSLFLKPVPGVRTIERILVLYTQIKRKPPYLPISFPNFQDLRQSNASFSELGAAQAIEVALGGEGPAEQVPGELVTSNYFAVLGIEPTQGRLFLPEEDRETGVHPAVVLSEALWQRRFGGDPTIIGRAILLNQRSFIVVGVVGGGFRGTSLLAHDDLWVPMALFRDLSPAPELMSHRGDQTVQVLGRIRRHRSPRAAAIEVRSLAVRLAATFPADNRDQTIVAMPLAEAQVHPNGRASLLRGGTLLMFVSGILLVITCSNVSSLLLARALRRTSELTLRAALGARRGRLARQLLVEGLLFATIAVPASALVADLGARILWVYRPPMLAAGLMPRTLDGGVLGVLLAITAACVAAIGLIPALHLRRLAPAAAFGDRVLGGGSSRPSRVTLNALVAIEVALGFVAVSCAVFFLVRLRELQRVDPGFDSPHLLALSFNPRSVHLDRAASQAIADRLRERISSLPGVRSVAFAENRLLDGFQILRSVRVPGRDGDSVLVGSGSVDADYFNTVGVSVLGGRGFVAAERSGARVAIVSQRLAGKLWPGGNPVGKPLQIDDGKVPAEVVGVVREIRVGSLDEPPRPFLYLPLPLGDCSKMSLHVRTSLDPAALVTAVEREARMVAHDLPFRTQTIPMVIEQSLSPMRASAYLLSILSLLALAVAAIGIHGVMAYAVGRRRLEIGLRIAMGAERRDLVNLIWKDGAVIVLAGAVLGTAGALGMTRWAASLLHAQPASVSSFLGSAVLLVGVSVFASALPLAQAIRMEPSVILREF